MELRHIRYFLAVAEEGNFTRAAAKLGIGQPPLSQQIRDLEREVGAQLFHRVPHGAELTEAGQAFRAEVAGMPGMAQHAMVAARRAQRGETGRLSLGFTATVALNPLVPQLIRRFRRDRPGVELALTEGNSVTLRTALLDGRLDVALLRPDIDDPAEMVCDAVQEEPMHVALPRSRDPDPASAELDLARLAAMPLILTPRAVGISLHDTALAVCRRAGFEPVLAAPAPQIASILSLVSAELGFTLVPASMRQLAIDNIVYKPPSGPPAMVSFAAATIRGRVTPPARAFVDLVRRTTRCNDAGGEAGSV